ncbi:CPBP family intramembrane glutamic endopeptidase [Cellulomonas aerilata]|uniref:CAAX prenyl protease 2/Lysostaphin resistance protein A-like domain-containing protein n=1 Tax=Cellulomonas aerilata TaxID=515326 RepID=A0A512DGW7_9CELL|nr:CPBP family intramembrane glutamic endopeptidase [Cellulomonas aerilata]GEO35728.1 hypothetical protein CAE01nite_34530 [Cellulomonas aerilata]
MNPTLDALQSLDVAPATVAALVLAVVVLGVTDPVLGRRDHRALLAELAADPAGAEAARVRFYRRWVRGGWLWAAAVVALVTALPDVGLAALGLRAPDLAGLGTSVWRGTSSAVDVPPGDVLETAAGMLVGLLLGTAVVVAVLRLVARARSRSAQAPRAGSGGIPLAGSAALTPMLPTTPRGRRGWAALSVTAGVTEEITYRGLVLLTLALLLPTADPRVVVVIAAVLFGAAHAYQGWAGMLATGLAGAVFAGLYLATGSLVVPMGLHVLVDLRALLLTPRPVRRRDTAGTVQPAQPVSA